MDTGLEAIRWNVFLYVILMGHAVSWHMKWMNQCTSFVLRGSPLFLNTYNTGNNNNVCLIIFFFLLPFLFVFKWTAPFFASRWTIISHDFSVKQVFVRSFSFTGSLMLTGCVGTSDVPVSLRYSPRVQGDCSVSVPRMIRPMKMKPQLL